MTRLALLLGLLAASTLRISHGHPPIESVGTTIPIPDEHDHADGQCAVRDDAKRVHKNATCPVCRPGAYLLAWAQKQVDEQAAKGK
jgi:hypothetical protein